MFTLRSGMGVYLVISIGIVAARLRFMK